MEDRAQPTVRQVPTGTIWSGVGRDCHSHGSVVYFYVTILALLVSHLPILMHLRKYPDSFGLFRL
jgi:hypothetical protein